MKILLRKFINWIQHDHDFKTERTVWEVDVCNCGLRTNERVGKVDMPKPANQKPLPIPAMETVIKQEQEAPVLKEKEVEREDGRDYSYMTKEKFLKKVTAEKEHTEKREVPKKGKLTDEEKEEINKLNSEGVKYGEIAKKLNRIPATVYAFINYAKHKEKLAEGKHIGESATQEETEMSVQEKTASDRNKVIELWDEGDGMTPLKISEKLRVSTYFVNAIIEELENKNKDEDGYRPL